MTRTIAALAALLAALSMMLGACGSGEDEVARDRGGDTADGGSAGSDDVPGEVPAAPGRVSTRDLVTVMDTGEGPEVCLGAVAESYPPQCGGPAMTGWDWADHPEHERQGRVRWGSFALTGTWDGTTLDVTDAVPAALYDVMVEEPAPDPLPSDPPRPEELQRVAERLGSVLAGAQGAHATEQQVYVDVTYDDGSLQAWADATYGEHVVVVVPALVDARG